MQVTKVWWVPRCRVQPCRRCHREPIVVIGYHCASLDWEAFSEYRFCCIPKHRNIAYRGEVCHFVLLGVYTYAWVDLVIGNHNGATSIT
jgi:hypothetical protein